MKYILSLIVFVIACNKSMSQIVNIPDANFKRCLVFNYEINTNQDNEIQVSEAENADKIFCKNEGINDLKGIEAFKNLVELDVYKNQLTELDVTKNLALQTLVCNNNQLTHIDLSQNIDLKTFTCNSNMLTGLNLSKNINLTGIACHNNNITNIDLSKNINLKYLYCTANNIQNLDLSNNANLEEIDCSKNNIENLDLTKNIKLNYLVCNENKIQNLDLSKNSLLDTFEINKNLLTNLDLSKNNVLVKVRAEDNLINNINLGNNENMNYLSLEYNKLKNINVFNNANLETLALANNSIIHLDLSNNKKLFYAIRTQDNQLESLNLKNISKDASMVSVNNPKLTCIQVDDPSVITGNKWFKDSWATYSTDCNYAMSVENETKTTPQIFPNPTKDILNIDIKDPVEHIQLLSYTGQLLHTYREKKINISTLPKGVYLIKVKTKTYEFVKKIIKE